MRGGKEEEGGGEEKGGKVPFVKHISFHVD